MGNNRFSKLLLIVLALALWAGTAYGQALTATPPSWSPSYLLTSEAAPSQIVGITASADGTGYTIQNTTPWLSATGGTGTANIASGESITIALIAAQADLLSTGPNAATIGLTAAGNVSGTPDVTINVILTVGAAPAFGAGASVTLTYLKGGGASQPSASQNITVTSSDSNSDSYTKDQTGCPGWLQLSSSHGFTTSSGQSDTLTFSVNSAAANSTTGGSTASCSVLLKSNGVSFATVSVNYTITSTGSSPLSLVAPATITLTYVRFGGAQASASVNASFTSTDSTLEALSATVLGSPAPTWLTATPTTGFTSVSSSTQGKITFAITPGAAADALSPGTGGGPYTVNVVVAGQPALAVTVNVVIQAQTLSFTTTSAALSFTVGGSTTVTQTAIVKSTVGPVAFAPDATKISYWLSVSGGTANPTTGATVTFTAIPTVLPALAVGNYSASVGFLATVVPASGVAEFYITVQLSVSSTASTISVGSSPAAVIIQPGTTPTFPSIIPVSSRDPVAYSATCSASTTDPAYVPPANPCTLEIGTNPASATITGVAYTWATSIAMSVDVNMFAATAPYGAAVTITVTVTPTNGTPVQSLTYTYDFQPVAATMSSITPTSVAANGTSPVVIAIKGANFVPSTAIVLGGSLSPTQVVLSTTATTAGLATGPWTAVASNVSIVNSGLIMVTLPSTSLPAVTGTATSAKLFIGVVNQTGGPINVAASNFKPDASSTLNTTTNPVIYSITSTASFATPTPGTPPKLAEYELVSIFGQNFGATGSTIATPDAVYGKYPASLIVGTSGAGNSAKPILMKVVVNGLIPSGNTTKAVAYNAPILFANANQINVALPGGLNLGAATVQVSSGTSTTSPPTSDPFPITLVAADPGVFTLTSSGTGQGAIINQGGVVNGPGYGAKTGAENISIYMTGLGIPNSVATDSLANSGVVYPDNCVSVSSYLSLVNTSVTASHYTAPNPTWTGLEGALMNKVLAGYPPCMVNTGNTAVSVSFNGGPGQAASYAGWVSGAVSGLYQVNVPVPSGLATTVPVTIPLTVTINGVTSPAVDVVIKP